MGKTAAREECNIWKRENGYLNKTINAAIMKIIIQHQIEKIFHTFSVNDNDNLEAVEVWAM